MPLENGTQLGPYEILEPIASPGGERYKATDTRSHRVVAITLLPPGFSSRSEVKARLERDTREIASLEHSAISGPIEVGHQDPSMDFVVAEFVDGETLAERLRRGPIPVAETLEIAVRLAESLDQAHRRGVVHGGLNPANVMLTDDGPKLLDFGMTRILEDSSANKGESPDSVSGASDSETPQFPSAPPAASMATTRHLSSPLATALPLNAGYMAPELLSGAAPDPRADIFSFGAVLYEMLTGRPAFEEKTPALLLAAIQTVDPEPPSSLQPMVPAALDHLAARCLEKDPGQRLQTARDLARQLQWVAEGGSQVGIPVPVASRRRTHARGIAAALAAGLVLAAILTPAAWRSFRNEAVREAVRFTLPPFGTNSNAPISVSPDGRWIAGTPGGTNGLVAYELDSVTPQLILGDYIVFQPFWSPDSRSIAFFSTTDNLLRRVDLEGGAATTITEAPPPISPGGWNQDGVILFGSGGVIQRVLAAGGDATPLTSLDPSAGETEHLGPSFLPDGRHFLYTAISDESALYVGSLDSPQRTRLFAADGKALYAEPGYIVFNRADALFAQPFDPDRLELTGEAIRIEDGLTLLQVVTQLHSPSMARWANFAVSQTGVLAFKVGGDAAPAATNGPAPEARILEWRDRNGQATVVGPTEAYAGIDLSPDGRSVALHAHEADGGDVWTFNFDQGRMQRLTFDASQHNASPIWSPDGERIAFASQRNNRWGLYVRQADGTGDETLVFESEAVKMPMSWSPEGLVVFWQNGDVWAVAADGEADPFQILDSEFAELYPTVSPAGGWIAYQSNETGRPEIYVKQFPDGPTKRQVSVEGGQFPRWRADGQELYYNVPGTGMLAVSIDIDGASIQPGIPQVLFQLGGNPTLAANHSTYHRYAVSADGQRFLVSRPASGNANPGGGTDAQVLASAESLRSGGPVTGNPNTVVLNWPEMLAGR